MENITITVPGEQAQALIDACNCFSDAAEGNLGALLEVWMPSAGPDMGAANAMMLEAARHAQEAAHQLRAHVDGMHRRDADLQEFLHRCKMRRKYGEDYDEG